MPSRFPDIEKLSYTPSEVSPPDLLLCNCQHVQFVRILQNYDQRNCCDETVSKWQLYSVCSADSLLVWNAQYCLRCFLPRKLWQMMMCLCRVAVCLLLLCSGESKQCTHCGTEFHRATHFNTHYYYLLHFRVAMTLSWFVFQVPTSLPLLCFDCLLRLRFTTFGKLVLNSCKTSMNSV